MNLTCWNAGAVKGSSFATMYLYSMTFMRSSEDEGIRKSELGRARHAPRECSPEAFRTGEKSEIWELSGGLGAPNVPIGPCHVDLEPSTEKLAAAPERLEPDLAFRDKVQLPSSSQEPTM